MDPDAQDFNLQVWEIDMRNCLCSRVCVWKYWALNIYPQPHPDRSKPPADLSECLWRCEDDVGLSCQSAEPSQTSETLFFVVSKEIR